MPAKFPFLSLLLIPLGLFVIICGIFTFKGGLRSVLKFYGISSTKNPELLEHTRKILGGYFIFSGILTALAGAVIPGLFSYRFYLGLSAAAVYIIAISTAGIHTGIKIGNENKNRSSRKMR